MAMGLFGKKPETYTAEYEDVIRVFGKMKKNDEIIVSFHNMSEIQIGLKIEQIIYKLVNLEQLGGIASVGNGTSTVTFKRTN